MLGNSYNLNNFPSHPLQNKNTISNNIYENNYYRPVYSRAAHYLDPIPEHSESFNSSHSTSQSFPNSIGEYGMGRLLGRGAFGSVYEVTEIRRKTPLNEFKYAIKIVRIVKMRNLRVSIIQILDGEKIN